MKTGELNNFCKDCAFAPDCDFCFQEGQKSCRFWEKKVNREVENDNKRL